MTWMGQFKNVLTHWPASLAEFVGEEEPENLQTKKGSYAPYKVPFTLSAKLNCQFKKC